MKGKEREREGKGGEGGSMPPRSADPGYGPEYYFITINSTSTINTVLKF